MQMLIIVHYVFYNTHAQIDKISGAEWPLHYSLAQHKKHTHNSKITTYTANL